MRTFRFMGFFVGRISIRPAQTDGLKSVLRWGWTFGMLSLLATPVAAQQPVAPLPAATAPAANAVAATVNGQPIPEVAVQRGLKRVPPTRQAEVRSQILDFLIGNLIVDQYLLQLKIDVQPKEVEARIDQLREEIRKQGQTFDKVLQDLMLTEPELRTQITADIRWDKFLDQQLNDKTLREFFDKNPEMFDGSTMHARHILLSPPPGDAQAAEQAKTQLLGFKKQIEDEAAKGLAKLPPDTDNLGREKARTRLIEDTFATLAREKSACPSQAQGGDLGWFPRAGSMVEPFAKAAFALQPYHMSDVVATEFGYHLILATERRPGKETKFEEVKDAVKEVYGERLRDAICAQYRPRSKIVVSGPPKP
jgi:peptidyl-prolyl cis-trans isomerase C